MAEPEGMSSASGVGSIVPHFYYDLIGRIIPGAFLMVGIVIVAYPDRILGGAAYALKHSSELGPTTLILGAVTFGTVAYLVGFLLPAVSYEVIEKPWKWLSPWRASDIPASLRREHGARTEVGFSEKSCYELPPGGGAVEDFARVCGIFVWAVNPLVGSLGSRWDAEALASRSVLFVSAVLAIWSLFGRLLGSHQGGVWEAVFFGVTAAAAFLTHRFQRKRHIVHKFDLAQAMMQALPLTRPTDANSLDHLSLGEALSAKKTGARH